MQAEQEHAFIGHSNINTGWNDRGQLMKRCRRQKIQHRPWDGGRSNLGIAKLRQGI